MQSRNIKIGEVYAVSTDNWSRPPSLYNLQSAEIIEKHLEHEYQETLCGVKVRFTDSNKVSIIRSMQVIKPWHEHQAQQDAKNLSKRQNAVQQKQLKADHEKVRQHLKSLGLDSKAAAGHGVAQSIVLDVPTLLDWLQSQGMGMPVKAVKPASALADVLDLS